MSDRPTPFAPDAHKRSFLAVEKQVSWAIKTVSAYMTNHTKEEIETRIRKAYEYSRDAHDGYLRKSGEPYIIHPVGAMVELISLRPDLATIESVLLHDVPEDTDRTIADIEEEFGHDVAYIVAGVEKVSRLKYRGDERSIGSLRKMLLAMSEDIRVIFVKLADRLHNMRTLTYHDNPEKQHRIALETLNIYAPIADRLGIFGMKEALENECFRNLSPEKYYEIKRELDAMRTNQEIFVSRVREKILKLFKERDIPIRDISYRVKSPYSIHKKMLRKNIERISDLYDLFAIRIITETVADCYDILGVIHNRFVPLPKRFKDYIALPKENNYQSLHTTVVGIFREFEKGEIDRRQPTEIQIRTKEMHDRAEIGIAAHFTYSEEGHSGVSREVKWVSELKTILDETMDSDFLSNMKITVFDDRIFAFTPKGEIKTLPKGSTPIDFAYAVHSEVGNHTTIARVNDKVVPLDHELRNGDRVEIITDRNKRPSIIWLSFVRTVRAKEVIKGYINREKREELVEKGKFIMNTYLQRHFGKSLDKELSLLKNLDGHVLGGREKEDVLVQIGNLSRKPSSIIRGLDANQAATIQIPRTSSETGAQKESTAESARETDASGLPKIVVGGEKNLPYVLAKCCNIREGKKIIAHVGRHGIKIHDAECTSLVRSNMDRIIPAHFENESSEGILLDMTIVFKNSLGMIRQLGDTCYAMRLNITELHTKDLGGNRMECQITVASEAEDYYLFERLSERLKLSMPTIETITLVGMR